MKILAIGDFHGIVPKSLKTIVKKNKIELILCTGDLSSGDRIEWKYWNRLMAGERLEDIVGRKKMKRLIAKEVKSLNLVFKFLDRLNVPVVMVYGNGDVTNSYLKQYSFRSKGIEDSAKSSRNISIVKFGDVKIKGLTIIGISGYKGYSAKNDNYAKAKKSNAKTKKLMDNLVKKTKGDFIFLTHDVPIGKMDKVRNKKSPVNGQHVGEKFYLYFDKKFKPVLHVCGHMHENQGTEKVEKTVVVNPGFGNKGQAAIIDYPDRKGDKIKIKFIR